MPAPRRVPAATVSRLAVNCLGRMACAYMNPADPGHDHDTECLLDTESYAADLMLRVLVAATNPDDAGSTALDRLTELLDAIEHPQ